MPFGAHLEELRRRVFRVLVVVVALFLLGWVGFRSRLEAAFLFPYMKARDWALAEKPDLQIPAGLAVLSPFENVLTDMKMALVAALVVGLPYLLWELWCFVGAGLYPRERRTIMRYLPASLLLAAAGILFGYLFLIPLVLKYLFLMIEPSYMVAAYRLADTLSFFLMLTFALAIVFQLPLILLGLSAAGLVEAAALRKYRKHFILVAFVVCAVLTPPDPFSQSFMAVPTVLLYELGIALVAGRERKVRARAGAVEVAP